MSGSYTSLQNQYKELIIEKNFTALALLIKQNENFPPAENIVRLGFKSYLHEAAGSKVKLFYLMKLKEITSVRPDDDILKEACEIALGMNSPQILPVDRYHRCHAWGGTCAERLFPVSPGSKIHQFYWIEKTNHDQTGPGNGRTNLQAVFFHLY
jgi:hypothetical protein